MGRPLGIDLFSGVGGLSLGFEQAGFDVVAAIEIDPVHAAAHKFNFPKTVVIPKSVEQLTGLEIRLAAGFGTRMVDCVFGGAPCQGFSLIGQRVLDDPRNKLVLEFVRLVSELDAQTFVFENVKGLTLGRHKQFLIEFVAAFNEKGYEVRMPWKVLNAGNFGAPQSRERLILYGAKRGLAIPDYPVPSSEIAGKRHQSGLRKGPTCLEALGDLPNAEGFDELRHCDSVKTNEFGFPSAYAAEMRCISNDSWHFSYPRRWDSTILTSSARTDHSEISRRRFSEVDQGKVEPVSRLLKLPSLGVSNTLRAGTDGSRGAFTSPRPIHYEYNRCITVREMARLHGFPDWFRFNVTKWHGARQIGNAVPPPLARAVAAQVLKALGITPTKPTHLIELGDPKLLEMDISAASAHFNVTPPKSGRDRKSGATKRKQADIEAERISKWVAYG
jgi:DNA (cytosine-5)-methyltransferase 1